MIAPQFKVEDVIKENKKENLQSDSALKLFPIEKGEPEHMDLNMDALLQNERVTLDQQIGINSQQGIKSSFLY